MGSTRAVTDRSHRGDAAPAPAVELHCMFPLNLQWEELRFRPLVQLPGGRKEPKEVLRGCSSAVYAGTLTGVMGPSG
jgi:hypothetical protein